MAFVEVAVNSGLPHRQTFSYAVPEGMTLAAGDAVLVPFGRRTLQGIVMHVVDVPAFPHPKPVEARMGDRPLRPGRPARAGALAGGLPPGAAVQRRRPDAAARLRAAAPALLRAAGDGRRA